MPDRNVIDDSRPLPDHTSRRRSYQPRQLAPVAAAALSPPDLTVVSAMLNKEPGTWTAGELATLHEIRGRSGPEAGHTLGELIHEAEQSVDRSPLGDVRRERDRVQSQLDVLGARHPHEHATHLARTRVTREIQEAEAQLRQEIRDQYEPLLRTAPNAEHRSGVEAAMTAELARVDTRLHDLHQRRSEMEAEEARKIEDRLVKENDTESRQLTARLNGLNRELRSGGVPLEDPASEGLRRDDFIARMREKYGDTLDVLEPEVVPAGEEIDATRSPAA